MYTKAQTKSKNLLDLVILFFCCMFAVTVATVFQQTAMPVPTTMQQTTRSMEQVAESAAISQQLTVMNHTLVEIRNILTDIRDLMIEQVNADPLQTEAELYNSYADEIVEKFYPDLDVRYVKAIIYHESRYQPDLTNSKTGVKGLMQISPKWHTKRAENLGVTDLFDPYGNILVGCDILNDLTQKQDFNYALNFFAGGYPYANRYKSSTSPFVEQLTRIIVEMEAGRIEL